MEPSGYSASLVENILQFFRQTGGVDVYLIIKKDRTAGSAGNGPFLLLVPPKWSLVAP